MANSNITSLTTPSFGNIDSGSSVTTPEIGIPNSGAVNNNFATQFRDQPYYFEVWMYNQIDGLDPLAIPYFMIDSLYIEETLLTWVVKGFIILKNDFETLERSYKNINGKKSPMIFRTDGRNKLSVTINPTVPLNRDIDLFSGEDRSIQRREDFLNKWQMSYDFVIYDVEDLPSENNQSKRKKLYFYDERYQYFLERNIEYSTSKAVELKDEERKLLATDTLRELIDVGSLDSRGNITNVGFLEGGSISNPTLAMNDVEYWEQTSEANKIFFTSPVFSNVVDDINYVLPYCGSIEKGPCFLRFGRSKNNKRWNLISLSEYFRRSREEQIENLILEDSIGPEDGKSPYVPRSFNDVENFISGIASRITSYKFSPMVASDDKLFTNKPLHSFNFATGNFQINIEKNKLIDVIDSLESYAKEGLYNFTESANKDNAQILLNINQTKKDNLMIEHVFSPLQYDIDAPLHYIHAENIRNLIFLNESISFLAPGLTIRAPGKFISIEKLSPTGDDNFYDRFLGQWFITKVGHLFSQENYISEVVATKIDSFSKLWEKEDTRGV